MPITAEERQQSRILLVDDEAANIRTLERSLRRAGYTNVRSTTDSREVVDLCASFAPDLIVLDLTMPHLDGFQVLDALGKARGGEATAPVLVVTGRGEADVRRRCLAQGASDFLTRPYDEVEIGLRVGNLLETWLLLVFLRAKNDELERRVAERTNALESAHQQILERLARAAEFRDDDTGEHTQRVGAVAGALAHRLGLADLEVELIRRAAALHDVGKIAIPDAVLLKPGKLTPDEFDVIKTHAAIGAKLLAGSEIPLLVMACTIAHFHHENWDGTGYPAGLKGEGIPLAARITAIADVFDALTHDRPYKKAWTEDLALAEIAQLAGSKFDPTLVRAFVGVAR